MQEDAIKNAPINSVGADTEHLSFDDVFSISDMSSVKELDTKTAAEIMDGCYPPRTPIVPGLIFPGTSLLVGPPKIGKSFFLLQIAYHISTGKELWGRPVRQGNVLYLALEDDEQRLQKRMNDMFGTDSTENLYFATESNCIGDGLERQIRRFIIEHPHTAMIVIDVLQNVRKTESKSYADTENLGLIGEFSVAEITLKNAKLHRVDFTTTWENIVKIHLDNCVVNSINWKTESGEYGTGTAEHANDGEYFYLSGNNNSVVTDLNYTQKNDWYKNYYSFKDISNINIINQNQAPLVSVEWYE